MKREMGLRGIKGKELAAKIGAAESEVSRCINLQKPIIEIVIAISDELGIPYPFILPETEGEATHLATQRRLYKRDVQINEITAGVAGTAQESQTPPVVSEHAIRQRKPRRERPKARPSTR